MKLNKLALYTFFFACIISSSISEAKTLMGASGWSVKKVNAESPYCVMARNYESDILFTVAKNSDAEGTLALNFQRDIFDLTKSYKIQFSVGGISREFFLRPASAGLIIARIGQDPSLLMAMQTSQTLSVNIDSQNFEINLAGYDEGFNSLNKCLGIVPDSGLNTPLREARAVETKTVELPRPPVEEPIIQNNQIDDLLQENQRLTRLLVEQNSQTMPIQAKSIDNSANAELEIELSQSKQKNAELLSKIAQLESDLLQSRQSLNPDLSSVIAEKDAQIGTLKQQNQELKYSLDNTKKLAARISELEAQNVSLRAERDALKSLKSANVEPQVIVKEVIKEVPVMAQNVPAADAQMAIQMAEVETEAKVFQAERDEYRRLLQEERRRLKNSGQSSVQQSNSTDEEKRDLMVNVQKLEAEKQELSRQLELQKSMVEAKNNQLNTDIEPQVIVKEIPVVDNSKLSELQLKISELQNQIAQTEGEKTNLLKRMQVIDSEAALSQRELAAIKVKKLADDSHETIQKELEEKTLRAEVASLEAQNNMLRDKDIIERNKAKDIAKTSIRNGNTNDTHQTVAVLSGDEIRMIINGANIPLKSSIDRIDRLSGPDYAAFRWDTGVVYGSGEQSRISSPKAVKNAINNYIAKTESRCTDSFDKNIQNVTLPNGKFAVTADIACVNANADGAAASIVFFEKDGMFYALAHEADMNSFQTAMDMREKMLSGISSAF